MNTPSAMPYTASNNELPEHRAHRESQPPPGGTPSFGVSRLRVGLGTFVAIEAQGSSRAVSESGIAAAYAAIARVELLMHPTRAGSDLAALSDCVLGAPRRIHRWTWQVLDLCRQLNLKSGGIFDPCLAGSAGRLADLELSPQQCLRGPYAVVHVPLRLDLGGIAKGFAVDRAIEALCAAGCHEGLVNAGGDLAVFGERERDVLCKHDRGVSMVKLRDAALASSAVDDESRPAEHRGYYNGLDRGAVITGRVAIVARNAAIADGLTKCWLAGGASSALLDAFGARRII